MREAKQGDSGTSTAYGEAGVRVAGPSGHQLSADSLDRSLSGWTRRKKTNDIKVPSYVLTR